MFNGNIPAFMAYIDMSFSKLIRTVYTNHPLQRRIGGCSYMIKLTSQPREYAEIAH